VQFSIFTRCALLMSRPLKLGLPLKVSALRTSPRRVTVSLEPASMYTIPETPPKPLADSAFVAVPAPSLIMLIPPVMLATP
jgi:hypothetical protein